MEDIKVVPGGLPSPTAAGRQPTGPVEVRPAYDSPRSMHSPSMSARSLQQSLAFAEPSHHFFRGQKVCCSLPVLIGVVILLTVVASTYVMAGLGYVFGLESTKDVAGLFIRATLHAVASNASRNIEYSVATMQLTSWELTAFGSTPSAIITAMVGAIRSSGATFAWLSPDSDNSTLGFGATGYLGFRTANQSVYVGVIDGTTCPNSTCKGFVVQASMKGELDFLSNASDVAMSLGLDDVSLHYNNPHSRDVDAAALAGSGMVALGEFVVVANVSGLYAPALSIGIPLENNITGWLWADLLIDELPAFRAMLVVPTQIALVTADGTLFAASKQAKRQYATPPAQMPKALEVDNVLVREGVRTIMAAVDGNLQRIKAGTILEVEFDPPGSVGKSTVVCRPVEFTALKFDLYAVVVVPHSDWNSTLYSNLRWMLIASAFVSVTLSLLAWVCVKFVVRPLLRLEQAMQRVMHLDFSSELGRKSSNLKTLSVVSETRAMQITFLKMRKAVKAFSSYLQPSVVRVVLDSQQFQGLSMKEAQVTIYFSDIESFTSISEGLTPSNLVALVGEYLQEMSGIILDTGGTIDKYIGDAIMAFWNSPDPVADHPFQGVVAAVRCQRRLSELRGTWQAQGLPTIRQRIGLNTGTVLVGNYGCSTKMDFTVIGDAVNVASRLEGLNKKYGTYVMASEDVESHAAVRANFLTRPLGRVVVKGKSRPTDVFEVVERLDAVAPATRQAIEQYTAAMHLFYSRNFGEALAGFDAFLGVPEFQNEKAALEMVGQCRRFQQHPPPADWHGVDVLHEKF